MKNKFVRAGVVGGFLVMCSVSAATQSKEIHSHDMDGVEVVTTYKTPTAGMTHVLEDLTNIERVHELTVKSNYSYEVGRGFYNIDYERIIRSEHEEVEDTDLSIYDEPIVDETPTEVIKHEIEEDAESVKRVAAEPVVQEETSIQEEEDTQEEDIPSDGDYSWVTPEIEYMAKCVMAEEGNQPWEGLVAVIDSILNMRDDPDYPDTIYGVINNPGVFSVVPNGMLARANPTPRIYDAIKSQMEEFGGSRDNYDVMYFRTGHYHSFGTPLFRVNNVYFSGR